jgi:hypothetical protein
MAPAEHRQPVIYEAASLETYQDQSTALARTICCSSAGAVRIHLARQPATMREKDEERNPC